MRTPQFPSEISWPLSKLNKKLLDTDFVNSFWRWNEIEDNFWDLPTFTSLLLNFGVVPSSGTRLANMFVWQTLNFVPFVIVKNSIKVNSSWFMNFAIFHPCFRLNLEKIQKRSYTYLWQKSLKKVIFMQILQIISIVSWFLKSELKQNYATDSYFVYVLKMEYCISANSFLPWIVSALF